MASSLTQQTVLAALAAGRQPVSLIDGDFQQIITAINTLKTYGNYYADSGAVNAYSVTVPVAQVVTLIAGLPLQVLCGTTNTGSSTLTVLSGVNPLGTIAIVNPDGSALAPGQIQAGAIHYFTYDGSVFQLLNPAFGTLGGWQKVGASIAFGSFSIAGTSRSINLFSLVAGGVISGVKIKHSTAFSGGTITAVTMSVGISGSEDKYAGAFDVFQAVGNGVFQISAGLWSENNAVATQVLLTGVSTGGNLNALTAGVVDVWAQLSIAK